MNTPFPAYQGDEPYVFVCYAHENAARVYPEIQRLHEAGVQIWYGEGISPGTRWTNEPNGEEPERGETTCNPTTLPLLRTQFVSAAC